MKTKENINAVGSNSKSTAPNAVCWLDVILFEDNTFEVEIYYVDIVYEFKDEFNKRTFTTIKELDDFFKGEDVIYDCDKYIDYVKEKYKKPFKALLLDNVVVSQEMLDKIEKQCDISKCGGFINGMQYQCKALAKHHCLALAKHFCLAH